MPPHEPLVSDFGLGDFYETGLIEYWVANEIQAGYCGKLLFVFGGQTCPMHWHKRKHETFFHRARQGDNAFRRFGARNETGGLSAGSAGKAA